MAKPVSVFPYHQIESIVAALQTISLKAMRLTPLYLTRDEYVEAFIRRDHVSKLEDVYQLIGASRPSDYSFAAQAGPGPTDIVTASLSFIRNPELLVPGYVKDGVDMLTPTGQKIYHWAVERRRIGMLLGDARDVLFWLNDNCGNAKAFSLAFPALTAIMVRSGENTTKYDGTVIEHPLAKRAAMITKQKSFGTMPSLPREVVERIRDASALIQAFILTEGAEEPSAPRDAVAAILGVEWADTTRPAHYLHQHIIHGSSTRSFI